MLRVLLIRSGLYIGAGFVIPDLKVQKIILLMEGFLHIYIWVICNINGIKLDMQYSFSNI